MRTTVAIVIAACASGCAPIDEQVEILQQRAAGLPGNCTWHTLIEEDIASYPYLQVDWSPSDPEVMAVSLPGCDAATLSSGSVLWECAQRVGIATQVRLGEHEKPYWVKHGMEPFNEDGTINEDALVTSTRFEGYYEVGDDIEAAAHFIHLKAQNLIGEDELPEQLSGMVFTVPNRSVDAREFYQTLDGAPARCHLTFAQAGAVELSEEGQVVAMHYWEGPVHEEGFNAGSSPFFQDSLFATSGNGGVHYDADWDLNRQCGDQANVCANGTYEGKVWEEVAAWYPGCEPEQFAEPNPDAEPMPDAEPADAPPAEPTPYMAATCGEPVTTRCHGNLAEFTTELALAWEEMESFGEELPEWYSHMLPPLDVTCLDQAGRQHQVGVEIICLEAPNPLGACGFATEDLF